MQRLQEKFQMVQQKYIAGDWEDCLGHTGKFIEATLRCLRYHTTGEINDTVDVEKEINRLANLPRDSFDASIRVYIPRVCRALYDLRSNWGGGHDSLEVSPVSMDAQFAFVGVQWIMLELLRRFSEIEPRLIQTLIDAFEPPPFIIQRIEDDLVFLDCSWTVREAIIIIASYRYPGRVQRDEFVRFVTWKSAKSILNELPKLVQHGYLHKNSEGYLATKKSLTSNREILYKRLKMVC